MELGVPVYSNIDYWKTGDVYCALPVQPENGTEYLGIDLSRPRAEAERVRALTPSFGAIAEQGRRWALEHYSPRSTAKRFLELVL